MKTFIIVCFTTAILAVALSAQIWHPDTIFFGQIHQDIGGVAEMYSTAGLITFGYMPDLSPFYVNIICPCTGYLPHWMVRNLYLPDASWISTYQWISYQIDMTELGAYPGMPMEAMGYRCYLTDSALLSPPDPVDYDWAMMDTFTNDAEGIDYPDTLPGLYDDWPYPDFYAGEVMSDVEYRGCRMRNIDLDDRNHPDTDTYAGDRRACGPAAAANSLKWLADVNPSITIPDDIRTVMEELSGLMGRPRNGGVTPQGFIKGKLDYIAAHGLNICVKFQSYYIPSDSGDVLSSGGTSAARNMGEPTNPYPTWEWLKSEVEDSEDVEILYHGRKSTGESWGHAATVSGIEETSRGRKTIKIKHDRRQARADSSRTIQEDLGIYIDAYGRMRIRRKNATITGVISESPGDPFVNVGDRTQNPERFDIRVSPNPFNSSVNICVEGSLDPSGIEIYDIAGRLVGDIQTADYILNEQKTGGTFVWRPAESVKSGVYFIRIIAGDKSVTKRAVYLK